MWKTKLTIGCATAVIMLTAGQGMAAGDKVVVIPLGGGSGNAVAADVLKGKTFSNTVGDGISGTRPPAPVEKTGQSITFATGDDGDREVGEAWPSPRFWTGITLLGAGNIDYLTGLIWEGSPSTTARSWANAVSYCNDLSTGVPFGIGYSDWRLPTIKELLSLVDYGESAPALPTGHPYTVQNDGEYWSSSTYKSETNWAWMLALSTGRVFTGTKTLVTSTRHAWCVRGPY